MARVPFTPDHVAGELARDPLDVLRSLGMRLVFMVGDWNNGGFPYYPRWFYDEFPDITMVDASGAPVLAGMFGEEFGWPAIDHPVIADGGARHVRRLVGELRDEPAVLYWVLGGEALYSTYLQAGRWTDYAPNAQAHFRAWLARRYPRIDALNEAWGTQHASFAGVEMPRGPAFSMPWSDFLDFRFSAMAERFAWHYQAVRSRDRSRLALTCNHGDLYHGDWYAAMGARPEWYASSADGFETGQIMFGSDPDYFNLLYMESLAGFGKPISPNRLAYKFPDPKARGGGTSFTPEAARRYLMECLGWGNWHVGVVQWRGDLPDGEWGVKGTAGLTEIERVFDEWARTDADRLHMRALKPRVAVYLSNQTWSLRGFRPEWNRLHNALVRRQVPVVYLYDSQLASGRLDGIDVIVSIGNEVVPDGCRAALRAFVARGGRLVCQGVGVVYDQWLRPCSASPWPDGAIRPRDTAAPAAVDVDAVVRAIEALRTDVAISPWLLDDGGTTVTEQRVTATVASHNWPLDLAGHASVEQTFRVAEGAVRAVAACIPTFNHPQGAFGLTLEVRRGGPQGELLGSRTVAAGDVADNAWCTVGLDRPLPAGEEGTLTLKPDPGTTPLNLGVWAAAEDRYVDGSLSIDGQPAPGDLELQLTWDAQVAASEPVEAFCLSDGLSLLGVFVNTAGVPVSVTVAGDKRTVPDPRARYAIRVIPDGADLGTCRGESLSFPLTLAPHGSAMVLCERVTGERDGSQAVAWAARAAAQLRGDGVATPYQEYLAAQAARLAERGEWPQAAACAGELTRQLGLRISESSPGRRYRVRVVDLAGRPVDGARVTADFVPTEGFARDLEPLGGGEYRLRLRTEELPAQYYYAARRYVRFSGPLRIIFTARHQGRRGQVLLDAVCP